MFSELKIVLNLVGHLGDETLEGQEILKLMI